MTIKTAIEITVNLLGNIAVPRNLNETVGIPIDSAIANLNLCLDAIRTEEEAQRKAAETEPEIEMEIEPEDPEESNV